MNELASTAISITSIVRNFSLLLILCFLFSIHFSSPSRIPNFPSTKMSANSTLDHTKWKFKLNTGDEIPAVGLGKLEMLKWAGIVLIDGQEHGNRLPVKSEKLSKSRCNQGIAISTQPWHMAMRKKLAWVLRTLEYLAIKFGSPRSLTTHGTSECRKALTPLYRA
jgi:hypothetical protein